MLESTCCPDCGAELPTGATGGLCPRCLLGAGISSDSPFDLPADSPFAATTPQAGGFVPPAPASLAAYFPDLEVLEIIGQGGMGAVYKARQTKLDRLVALKIIRPETADDPAFAERFTREAKTLARLNHSNIVSVHDFGELELAPGDPDAPGVRVARTLYFFVMEFVDGANLRQLMESGRLQAVQSLAIVPQICDALQYAHDEGVIHRDIKPENILVDRRGRVKIADFGLAKLAGQSPENFTLTGTHQVMGTPRYMAPEQMSGSRLVDHRADIYSLGVVLYEMLTGELPMGRFEAPSRKAAVDARLDDVVHRALATEPDRRYQRASEIRTDMEAIALDSISHGEFVDASTAAGFPGPSTIMERQVAGMVNWFREGGDLPSGGRLSRDDAQSAVQHSRLTAQSTLAMVLQHTTLWGVLIALGGIAVVFQPWAEIYNSARGTPDAWYSVSGFAWSYGMVAISTLILTSLFLVSTSAVRPVPLWRPIIVVVGALAILACCGTFIVAIDSGTLAVQPLLDAASWGVEIEGGATPRTIGDWSGFVVRRLGGPYLLMGIAVGLLVVAAVDFRLALQVHPAIRKRTDLPQFSRKAILGACWAPLFFLAVAGMTIVSDITVHRGSPVTDTGVNAVLKIPAAIVGILGVLAPCGTTILGMLAISDIRHSRSRGLGLAYLDAIFFPLLMLNAMLLIGAGIALSATGMPGVSWMAIALCAPLFFLLDVIVGVCGWRYVSRSVPTVSHATVRPGVSGSDLTPGEPAVPTAPAASSGSVPTVRTSTPPAAGPDSSISSLELRRIEMRVKAPAAGLMIAAFLNLGFWIFMGFVTFQEVWGMQNGRFNAADAEILGAAVCAVVVLLAVGTIIQGARHLRRLTGIGWCYAAAILAIIPWGALSSIVGMFVGVWVLNVLGNTDVKEAFVQRSLELDQRN